ncbi:transferrin isoform X2 [Cryptotermes secundus]|uniref:transferrin isoform X2 n=1 Tax=Cryptotermes secundus TaxID=105785 RepID=UPI000CD7B6A7|nr:transferrin isoform X2 [Cryptotermes secundus]
MEWVMGSVIDRICVTERQATTNDCDKLKKTESKFNCVRVIDNTDCALKLERGEADFGIFTAEEAILASKFDTKQQLVVIGDIRDSKEDKNDFQFETVAVVKENFPGSLKALKGKKFCHPGFSKSQLWSDRVLKHFERVVLTSTNSVSCDESSRTAAEDELSALSSFFESACRPGEWVPSDHLDKRFKRKYSNLCNLCDPAAGCYHKPQMDSSGYATLDCLTKKGGDVAYVAYYSVQEYFGRTHGNLNNGPEHYRYLCPNGTLQNVISNERPCKWIQQPWRSIIVKDNQTSKDLMTQLQKIVPTTKARRSHTWMDTVNYIITGSSNKLHIMEASLRSFIQKGREIPQPGNTLPCRKPIKWCTTSKIENNKCEWLREAALTQGIVPDLQCVQGTSHLDCSDMIRSRKADIIGIDSNLGPIASHSYNLRTVMYQETIEDGHFKVVAVINSRTGAANLTELKNKKACFPEFGGLAWIACLEAIRNSSVPESEVCPYDDSMGTFFKSVCAPGYKNRITGPRDTGDFRDLCSLCSEVGGKNDNNYVPFVGDVSCAATIRNKFYGDLGALRCLASGYADVAFVNAYNLSDILRDKSLSEDFSQKHSIVCHNGTKIPLTAIPDDNCALTVVTGGELVARGSRSTAESKELYLTLLELDEWFGSTENQFWNIFHLYKEFNNTKDLLFRGETLGILELFMINEDRSVQTYADLKTNSEKCKHPKKESGAKEKEVGKIGLLLMLIMSCLLF